MTIRVIDEGPDPSVVKQVVCANCGVKLEFLPIDVKQGRSTDYGGGTDTWNYIECPKCSHHIRVKTRNLT